MTFGEKLQKLRKEHGLSQERLAAQIAVSRQALSKWELGTAVPDTENVLQISRLFGVSVDYLLYDEYESDRNIPAVQTENKVPTANRNGIVRNIAGCVLSALGMIGLLVIAILSSVYPAVIYDPPQGEVRTILKTGWAAFLELHQIGWLFALCCALAVIGIVIIAYPKIKAFLSSLFGREKP